jgi:antitoxin component of MazEF toxin-antitoxin module
MLDVLGTICHVICMAITITKVSGGESSFRIVIPKRLIEEMQWEDVDYVTVELHDSKSFLIRRLFDDGEGERQDR